MPKVILSLLLLMGAHRAGAQEKIPGLVINELMQSNIDCVMDDRTEFPDSWVELYNHSGEAVALKDYRLGIGTKAEEAYQLPPMTVQPKDHILIFCDREKTGLHTSFRLESGKGCTVYLFKGNQGRRSIVMTSFE